MDPDEVTSDCDDELVSPESVILLSGGELDEDDEDGDNNSVFNYELDPLDVDDHSSILGRQNNGQKNFNIPTLDGFSVEASIQVVPPWILDHSYVKSAPHFVVSKIIESTPKRSESAGRSKRNYTPRSARGIGYHTLDLTKDGISKRKQPQSSCRLAPDKALSKKNVSMRKCFVEDPRGEGTKKALMRKKNGSSERNHLLSKSPSKSGKKKSGKRILCHDIQVSQGRTKVIRGKMSKKVVSVKTKSSHKIGKDVSQGIEEASSCSSVICGSSQETEVGKNTTQSEIINKNVEGIEINECLMQSNNTSENTNFRKRGFLENNETLDDANILRTPGTETNSLVGDKIHEDLAKCKRPKIICKNFEKKIDEQIEMEVHRDTVKESFNSAQEDGVTEIVAESHKLPKLGVIGGLAAKSKKRWGRKRGRGRRRNTCRKVTPETVGEDCDKNKTILFSVLDVDPTKKILVRQTSKGVVIPEKKMVGPNGKSVDTAVSEKMKLGDGFQSLSHSSFSPRVVIERNFNLRRDSKAKLSSQRSELVDAMSSSSSKIANSDISSSTTVSDENPVVAGMGSSEDSQSNDILSKNIHGTGMLEPVTFVQQKSNERNGIPVGLISQRRGRSRGHVRFTEVTPRKVLCTGTDVSFRAGINNETIESNSVVGHIELPENENALRVTRSSSEKRKNEANDDLGKEKEVAVAMPVPCDGRQKRKCTLKVTEPETSFTTITNSGVSKSPDEKTIKVGFTGSKTSMQLSKSREISVQWGARKVRVKRSRRRRGRHTRKLPVKNKGGGKTSAGINSSIFPHPKKGVDATKQNDVAQSTLSVVEKSISDDSAPSTVEEARLNGNVDHGNDGVCVISHSSSDVCNNGPVIVNVSSVRSQGNILKHVNSDLEFISDSSEDEIPIIMDIMSLSEESEELNSRGLFSSQAEFCNQVTNDIGEEESVFEKDCEENPLIVDAVQESDYCNSVLPDPCPYCRMHFADALSALTHSHSCSKSSRSHVISCHICDRLYVRIEDLDAHMKIHR